MAPLGNQLTTIAARSSGGKRAGLDLFLMGSQAMSVNGIAMDSRDFDAASARDEAAPKSFHPTRRSPAMLVACESADRTEIKTRTLEVLLCALAGDSNAEIARRLEVSISTVKTHLSRLVAACKQDR